MKRNILITILAYYTAISSLLAQITYEHTYPFVQSQEETRVQLVDIGDNEYKYIYVDHSQNQLRIFNLDHSEYSTITFPVAVDPAEFYVGYVTKSLFDCDTNMYEYAIMSRSNWRNSFYVFREDGIELFREDSTLAPYCFGCYLGSYDVRPIINTPLGAKLFLAKATANGDLPTLDVYSLCGSLPDQVLDLVGQSSSVMLFPNPSSSEVNFVVDLPTNLEQLDLLVFDVTGSVVKRWPIANGQTKFVLNTSQFSSGLYTYSLMSNHKLYETDKFIITK